MPYAFKVYTLSAVAPGNSRARAAVFVFKEDNKYEATVQIKTHPASATYALRLAFVHAFISSMPAQSSASETVANQDWVL